MAWTKRSKKVETGGTGFLEGLGFLIEGFLQETANLWRKITKVIDS
jgi:hypothetical protein